MAKDTLFQIKTSLNAGGKILDLSTPKVMGILNITPDSFFEGSRVQSQKDILHQAEKMILEGADILDLGAYSSRPGATDISVEEERERLIPALQVLVKHFPDVVFSIDTFRASIAKDAIENGAHIINDISGGNLDVDMYKTVAELGVPYILMHMRGTPQNMKDLTVYDDLLTDINSYFSEKIMQLKLEGVKDIIIDPGFGFAKNSIQNYSLLKNLADLRMLGFPVLAGLSRKGMIYKNLEIDVKDALNGTSVLNTIALLNGASILRVHDVKEAKEVIKLVSLLK
jgi:dihydropteroate synthase